MKLFIIVATVLVSVGGMAQQPQAAIYNSKCVNCSLGYLLRPSILGTVPASFFNITVNKAVSSVWPGTNKINGVTAPGGATAVGFNIAGVRSWNMTGGAGPNAACAGATWNCINYASGLYDWGAFDTGFGQAITNGQTSGLLVTSAGTPSWAGNCPNGGCQQGSGPSGCGLNGGPANKCYPPNDICTNGQSPSGSCAVSACGGVGSPNALGSDTDFKIWISALINHIAVTKLWGGYNWIFEIWNEPNVVGCTGSNPGNGEWRGTEGQLVAMACDAYFLIKQQNSSWRVTTPAPSNASSGWIDTFLKTKASAVPGRGPNSCNGTSGGTGCTGAQCVDDVAFHGYNIGTAYTSCGTNNNPCYAPESAANLGLAALESLSSASGLGFVDTEDSWGAAGGTLGTPTPLCGTGTSDPSCKRSAWLTRNILTLAFGWGTGSPLSGNWLYGWDTGTSVNLWNQGVSPQAQDVAGTAYEQLYNWIEGGTIINQCNFISQQVTTTVMSCNLETAGGIQRQIVWDSSMAGTGTNCMGLNNAANCKTYNVPALYQSGGGNTKVCTLTAGITTGTISYSSTTVSATGYQLGSNPVMFTPTSDANCN